MQQSEQPARKGPGLGSARRQAVDTTRVVETSTIEGTEGLPLMVKPAGTGVDLPEWASNNRETIDGYLDQHGAILFRGFGLDGASDFEAVASAVVPDLFAEYGDLPPESTSERIYHSTPYPADKMILFHNESSHLPTWPMRQFFFCVIPSEKGGTTPLLDGRRVYQALEPSIRDEFEQKGLTYIRNFIPGLDVSWQDFFKTEDRAEVEQACAEGGMTCEWTDNGGLRISQTGPAVITHPRTGEKVWFNQIQLHHPSALDDETRASLEQLVSRNDMPRNVRLGDGSEISDETMNKIGDLYEELCVEFPWDAGDMIVVDNMIVQHARRPFEGERKILVAMGRMMDAVPA
jgi:alpha-ketoglutarate-dependent taurine dioxygenase